MKRRIILIVMLLITLVSLSLYYTYAFDISIDNTVGDADLTFNIDITDTNARSITVEAGKTKVFDFFLTNNNGATINYGLAYSGTKPETVRIAQLSNSTDSASGSIDNNTTKQITLIVENKSSTDYTYTIINVAGYKNGGSLIVPSGYTLITDIYNLLPAKASDYIKSLAGNCTSWESGFSGICATNAYEDNGVTKYHEYRYVGANVDNWVRFNDDDYRIIGVFDDNSHGVEGEYLIKLISANELTSATWGIYNSSPSYTSYSGYSNNWTGLDSNGNSTNGTGVPTNANIILNEYFYNASSTSSTYGECINLTYGAANNEYKSKNCSNIVGYGIQTEILRNYIQPVTWYLYGYNKYSLSKANWYQCERNNYTNCTSANSGAYQGTTIAPIGLMYVSDYLYASGYIASNGTTTADNRKFVKLNWLHNGGEWTITPGNNNAADAMVIRGGGDLTISDSSIGYGLRPTFYLKSTIKIKSGSGSFDNPYVIG